MKWLSILSNSEFEYLPLIFLLLIPFLLSNLGTLIMKHLALQHKIIDIPNQRSSHQNPTPRGGGMAVAAAFLIVMLLAGLFQRFDPKLYWGLIISSLVIAVLGFLDDLYTLQRTPRIIAWVLITALSLAFGIELHSISLPVIGIIQFGFLSPLVTFLWLIGVTNIFNFMDGIDGLAGSEALIAAGFLAGIAFYSGNSLVFTASVVIFGAALGFLPYNFPQARIFMGDGGSNFLGYIFAALAIIGSQGEHNQIPFIVPVILLSMFLLDGGTTLIKRLPKGKDWLKPHRDHYYQRLIKLGFMHVQVTLIFCALNLILGVIALMFLKASGLLALGLLFVWIIPFIIVVLITHRLEGKSGRTSSGN